MRFIPNKSLASLNTFGFDQSAEWFCEPASIDDLREALDFAIVKKMPIFVLGGGSNIVLTADIPGLTIRQATQTIQYAHKFDEDHVSIDAGVNWHQLVLDTLKRGYNGLENLSLIPGNAGAAPIQNIGAYGVELADILTSVEVMHLSSGDIVTLGNDDCHFGYRDSIFKQQLKGKVLVLRITLKLSTDNNLHLDYAGIRAELENRKITEPDAKDVSDVVCAIRSSKLPNPDAIGNAGSFFKNPVINKTQFDTLKQTHSNLPGHFIHSDQVKVPAGWLIEQCGWKGIQRGGIGVHENQALVLTHRGGSNGTELMALSKEIQQSVNGTYGITLEQEPIIAPIELPD